jgi:hypothetical protein
LECELLDQGVFENRTAVRLAVFDLIEVFSNPCHRDSSIGDSHPSNTNDAGTQLNTYAT